VTVFETVGAAAGAIAVVFLVAAGLWAGCFGAFDRGGLLGFSRGLGSGGRVGAWVGFGMVLELGSYGSEPRRGRLLGFGSDVSAVR